MRARLDLLRGDPGAALRRLEALAQAQRADDVALVAWVGAEAALAGGDAAAAERWLAPVDIGQDYSSDVLAMALVQRLRVAAARGGSDDAARLRALALLEADRVPALEAAELRAALAASAPRQ